VQVQEFPFQLQKSDYYITISRLVSYKKISLIVEAFNQLGKPLVVIGDGEEMKQIQTIAKANITLLGSVEYDTLKQYLANAKAFVYVACEDFGIAIVEAQACGTPVIAYNAGGATETVIDIRKDREKGTGVLFSEQTVQGIIKGVETFFEVEKDIKLENCRTQAEKFSAQVFQQSYLDFLESCYRDFKSSSRLEIN
jgi:glycosyltransferase involved in cell wall biosynthesis